MSNAKYPIRGACQCGGVQYQLLSAPTMIVACHCKECQKLSTSAFSITAMVDKEQLLIEGEMADWRRGSDSGNVSAAKFCVTCGNRIYHFDPAKPDLLKLKPSTLEDTSIIQPTAHIWVSEKQDWYDIPEGMTVFQGQP